MFAWRVLKDVIRLGTIRSFVLGVRIGIIWTDQQIALSFERLLIVEDVEDIINN